MIAVLCDFDHSGRPTKSCFGAFGAAFLLTNNVCCITFAGSDRFYVPDGVKVYQIKTNSSYKARASALAALFRNLDLSIVLAPNGANDREILAYASGILGLPMLTDVVEITSDRNFKKYLYAGSVLASYKINQDNFILTVRANCFNFAGEFIETSAEPVNFVFDVEDNILELRTSESGRPELGSADVVVTGGRALGSKEAFEKIVFPLADCLKAAVGATRAAVDNGYAPNDWQVGQTGKVVAPKLYLAIGVSGAIQHIAGMKDSKFVAVVNKDPNAPIMEHADLALIGDLFEVVPQITQLFSNT